MHLDKSSIDPRFSTFKCLCITIYLLLLNAHAPSLPLSLPPSASMQHQWPDVLWRVTAAKTRHDSSTHPVVQDRAKTLRSQRKFSLSPKEQSRLWPSWRDDSEKVRPRRRQAAHLCFLFQCHAFPRNRKRVPWPLPYV